MSIIRAPRPASRFYVLDKQISEDKRLSWGARGLLVYLLGKPDHWKVSVAALINETGESDKPTRRDGVYSLIRELEAAGYLVHTQARGTGGTFDRGDYLVSELPHTDEPTTLPDEPHTAEPLTVETTLVSTDLEQGLNGEQGRKDTRASLAVRPEDVDPDTWTDFLAMRKAKRAPLTKTGLSLIQREADKARMTLQDALQLCCARGWQGFNAGWLTEKPKFAASGQIGYASDEVD